ncbi:helix-turn-helix domain-containing protein [Vibrio sp. SCSIO 43137]|uniref:helix-turn-helix domain-containing protein n=1 Tax=Vibrio sp. SCSIO 43137 TaxID=3021011 RepID=UPI00230714CE|nr:helix-turn-helix transcriptional regulator [Vibrio sp. SCSIO 43137]WCE31665.1 helix-turn-helix transcriptional regulator [Vibrio sp. SCSIO 43137]
MNDFFHKQLSSWLDKRGISRKELIALLQSQYHDEFGGLDSVTLSRWIKGHSTPSTCKQLYIAKSLDVNIADLITSVEFNNTKIPVKHSAVISDLIKILDKTTSYLSYDVITGEADIEIKTLNHSEYIEKFANFDKNASALKSYYKELYTLGNNISFSCILIKNEHKNIIGHLSGIIDIRRMASFKSLSCIPREDFDKSCIIHLGKYTSSKHYFDLIYQVICLHLLKYSARFDKAYFFIPDFSAMILFCKIVLKAEVIKYFPPGEKSEIGVYLVAFDILRVIASPVIIHEVKSRLECVKNCDPKCTKCNLRCFL